MRRTTLIAAALAVALAALPALPAVTKYSADVAHSNVGFSVPILGGLSQVRGKFNEFTVSITYDDQDVTKSSASATIKAASIRKAPDGKTAIGVTARTALNRKDLGVSFARPDNPDFLGDMVEVELNVITRAAAPEGAAAAAPAAAKP